MPLLSDMLQVIDPDFNRETEFNRMVQARTMFADINLGFKEQMEKASKMFHINTEEILMKVKGIS
jgi:hypothetical protein